MAGVAALQSDSRGQVPDQAELVDQTIAQGFALLSFPKELETLFLQESEARRFLMMVVAGLSAIVVFGALIIADYMMTPEVLPVAFGVRWGVFPPIIVAGLYILRKLRMPAVNEWLIAVAGLVAAVLEAWIVLSCTSPWAFARVVELNIVIVYTCAIARFWPAVTVATAIAMVHTYLITTLPDMTGGLLVASVSLLMLASIVFVLYGNYKLEHDERMAFLLKAREQALHVALTSAHERLTRMATTDVLTEVANRRYFETFLSECWVRAQQQRRCLSLIIVDIDYFKPYNDRYGHQAGDKCLIAVAQALKGCIRRPNDLLARWGGEEFVIVMMDADADAASAAAERMRLAVAGLGLVHEASACATFVTVSGGRATLRPDAKVSEDRLVHLADEALYRAKSGGRNRVCAGYDMKASP